MPVITMVSIFQDLFLKSNLQFYIFYRRNRGFIILWHILRAYIRLQILEIFTFQFRFGWSETGIFNVVFYVA